MLQTRRLCSGSAIGSSRKDAWLAGKRLKVDYFRVFVFFLFFWPNDLVGFLRWANMSFLFFWPRTHCMLHMRCLVVLSFFSENSEYIFVLSFLFFCSTLTFFPVLSVAFGSGFRQGNLCLAGWCFLFVSTLFWGVWLYFHVEHIFVFVFLSWFQEFPFWKCVILGRWQIINNVCCVQRCFSALQWPDIEHNIQEGIMMKIQRWLEC